MSAFMCMQLIILGEADCAQEYAVLFLGFAETVKCLQAANSRAADKICWRWLMIIIYLIFFWGVCVQHSICAGI